MVRKILNLEERAGRVAIALLFSACLAMGGVIWHDTKAEIKELKGMMIELDRHKVNDQQLTAIDTKLEKLTDSVSVLNVQLARHMGEKGGLQ
jgi:hypothetical protein